jgi:hypothetical protein
MSSLSPCYVESNHAPELAELCRRVQKLRCRERGELLALCQGLIEWSAREQQLFQAAGEIIAQLQLDNKYLHFDLECTRQERDAFREQLEQGF